MVQLKHNITGKINQMSEKQYNKMIALGQTFPNYTRVVDTKKLVTKIEKELKEKIESINETNELLINDKKNKKDDL